MKDLGGPSESRETRRLRSCAAACASRESGCRGSFQVQMALKQGTDQKTIVDGDSHVEWTYRVSFWGRCTTHFSLF